MARKYQYTFCLNGDTDAELTRRAAEAGLSNGRMAKALVVKALAQASQDCCPLVPDQPAAGAASGPAAGQDEDKRIAETILEQLGGNKFMAMTGARRLMAIDKGLQFDLPSNFARDGINRIRITLTPADTYKINFWRISRAPKFEVTPISVADDVGVENLRDVISKETGLALYLQNKEEANMENNCPNCQKHYTDQQLMERDMKEIKEENTYLKTQFQGAQDVNQRLADENRGLSARLDRTLQESQKPIDPTKLSKGDAIAIARVHLPHLLEPVTLNLGGK